MEVSIKKIIKRKYIVAIQQIDPTKIICKICNDISINPIQCNSCNRVFCLACATNYANKFNRCPENCIIPPQINIFSMYKLPEIQMCCPYNDSCPRLTSQNFQVHLLVCKSINKLTMKENKLRNQFKCNKQHKLQFWISKFSQMINSKCINCNQKLICRSICNICEQTYCIFCRPIFVTQLKCPIKKHNFIQKQVQKTHICDLCNGRPGYLIKGQNISYIDRICNFGICFICYNKLPIQQQQQFQFGFIQQTLIKSPVCNLNHELSFWCGSFNQMMNSCCSNCKITTLCRYRCINCAKKYCNKCKPIQFSRKCPLGLHKLIFRQKKKGEVCDICLQQRMIGQVYGDKICNFIVCEKCFQAKLDSLKIQKYQGTKKKIVNKNQTLKQSKTKVKKQQTVAQQSKKKKKSKIELKNNKCSSNHILKFWVGNVSQMLNSKCQSCKKKKLCRKICNICNQFYCIKCSPVQINVPYCPNNIHIMNFQKPTPTFICDNCQCVPFQKKLNIYNDKICDYGLCEDCYRNAQIVGNLQKK